MKLADALSLGRVSNLPTVWTNMLAAIVLAGETLSAGTVLALVISLSLFYIAGMYLNDAFDAAIDATERPNRPIPAGRVKRSEVLAVAFGMMLVALVLLLLIGFATEKGNGLFPFIGGIALSAAIILYNMWHKNNPISPLLMGLCRVLVYLIAAWCFTLSLPASLWTGALMLLCYLIGLTYVAKQENLNEIGQLWPLLFLAAPVVYGVWLSLHAPLTWIYLALFVVWTLFSLWLVRRRQAGDIPRAVVSLIAGMCLLDAVLIGGQGQAMLATVAVGGFFLTLFLQRYIAGT